MDVATARQADVAFTHPSPPHPWWLLVARQEGAPHLHGEVELDSFILSISNMLSKNISLEPPSVASPGDARYLTKLSVFGDELSQSATTEGFEVRGGNIDRHDQTIRDKIITALKLLALRKPRVLVQFWSPRVVGKHRQQLTTKDQPFGLGVNDERLLFYRRDSESKFYDVDKDYEEEEGISPVVRVFRQGSPEWSCDVTNYLPKHFPQQECAIRCNLHGYVALPVFDPTTTLCVGVIELLMSSLYTSFYYEVQQIQKALKKQDLAYQQVSGGPATNIDHQGRQNELNKIFSILKVVCDTHRLPFAQTWAISPSASVASHEHVLTKSCNRYDSRCLGKVCMSTVALPFYVPDLGVWPFRDACKAQHLEMSRGLVGKALSSRGSCFCQDVTKLSEEDYPLVHHARMSGLITSCFAIHLHSVTTNDGYVLEFFLPLRIEDSRCMLNLVQLMQQQVMEIAYGVDQDDNLPIQVIGPLINPYVTNEPYIMQTFSMNVSDEGSSTNVSVTFTDGERSSYLKQGKKRKRGSDDTMVLVTVTYGEDIKSFKFPISLGLLMLKYKVAKRFKLKVKMIRLKYIDEENDLITVCVDKDLNLAMVASGSKNSMNLICKLSAD
ncbi:PB1 domain-containing protein [Artemisia annua]|uniref:PB1 domain-containing protein n=1 Tax=Artemisia annua TaxID=35608 RepID=A0A2U1PN85_ARTAN|nr:PB1 domain-containing protein [Artemisia annua]